MQSLGDNAIFHQGPPDDSNQLAVGRSSNDINWRVARRSRGSEPKDQPRLKIQKQKTKTELEFRQEVKTKKCTKSDNRKGKAIDNRLNSGDSRVQTQAILE